MGSRSGHALGLGYVPVRMKRSPANTPLCGSGPLAAPHGQPQAPALPTELNTSQHIPGRSLQHCQRGQMPSGGAGAVGLCAHGRATVPPASTPQSREGEAGAALLPNRPTLAPAVGTPEAGPFPPDGPILRTPHSHPMPDPRASGGCFIPPGRAQPCHSGSTAEPRAWGAAAEEQAQVSPTHHLLSPLQGRAGCEPRGSHSLSSPQHVLGQLLQPRVAPTSYTKPLPRVWCRGESPQPRAPHLSLGKPTSRVRGGDAHGDGDTGTSGDGIW